VASPARLRAPSGDRRRAVRPPPRQGRVGERRVPPARPA